MTERKITQEWIVQNYLPEYENRLREHLKLEFPDGAAPYHYDLKAEEFRDAHFSEALEAFARHIWEKACRKQREERDTRLLLAAEK